MSPTEEESCAAVRGMPACQRDRYKKVTQNRRCFGSHFSPEFRGEKQSQARIQEAHHGRPIVGTGNDS
jgi:hypothetical protein